GPGPGTRAAPPRAGRRRTPPVRRPRSATGSLLLSLRHAWLSPAGPGPVLHRLATRHETRWGGRVLSRRGRRRSVALFTQRHGTPFAKILPGRPARLNQAPQVAGHRSTYTPVAGRRVVRVFGL